MGLNAESARLGREFRIADAEANAEVNLGNDYLVLGQPGRAFEHLQQATHLHDQVLCLGWRYNLRLQAELARYWITQGDLKAAATHATTALQGAEATQSRKYVAWAHKLLGDIAALEERIEDGERHYATALGILQPHPCPTNAWKILKAAAELAQRQKDDSAAANFLGQARAVVPQTHDFQLAPILPAGHSRIRSFFTATRLKAAHIDSYRDNPSPADHGCSSSVG